MPNTLLRLSYYSKLAILCVLFRLLAGSWAPEMMTTILLAIGVGIMLAERRGIEDAYWFDRPMLVALAVIIGRVISTQILGALFGARSISPWAVLLTAFVGFLLYRDLRGYRRS